MTDVTITRHLQTDLRTLWRAWTDPEQLETWLWPFPTTATIDLPVGGTWRVEAVDPATAVGGPITVVEPEERLELDWRWDGDDHTRQVSIMLRPSTDGGVDCDVAHAGNVDETETTNHQQGWSDCLDRLVRRFG